MADIVADPYSWPFPQRSQLMSLQTINQRDVGFPKYESKEARTRNFDVTDIRGASPEMKGYKYNQKETFVNRNRDIEGSSPKQLIKNLNKPEFNLFNSDIKGSQPQINKFQTTRTAFNPLTPEYVLPKAEIRVATPPKFVRDSIAIDDIQGTKPNPKFFKTRNVDIYTEIEGSKPKLAFIPKDHIDCLDVKDINEFLQFKTSRHSNPLNPTYITKDEAGTKIEFGPIKGSSSRRLHPVQSQKVNFNLTTGDIKGAWHDTHTEKFLMRDARKDFRTTNITKDLPETQVGSLKKGIITNRHVNPLTPKYQLLGENEGLKNYDTYTNPVKEQSIVNASKAQLASANKGASDTLKRSESGSFVVSQVVDQAPERELVRCQTQQNGLRNVNSKRPSVQSQQSNRSQGILKPPTPPVASTTQVSFPKIQTIEGAQFEGRNTMSRGSNAKDYSVSQHVGFQLTGAQKLDRFIS